jgi:signal transduction histidine kinase
MRSSAQSKGRLDVRGALAAPLAADVLVTLGIAGFALSRDHWDSDARNVGLLWVVDLALAVPLLWRRSHPLVVFWVISAVALALWLGNIPAGGSIAVLGALYAVGAYDSRRAGILAAAAVAELGVVMATVRWAPVGHRLGAFVLLTGTVAGVLVLGVYTRTRRAYITSALDRAATAERERDQRALLATAAERARISREMHDIVAHTLSVMVALSDGAAVSVEHDALEARDAMQQSATLGRQALSDLRRLLGGVREPDETNLEPAPGVAQVEELIAAVRSAGLPVDLVMSGAPPPMPPSLELAVYRLVQESLTNVLKHAPAATRAVVTLRYDATAVDVEVVNDDEVRSNRPVAETHGRGLTGMRERAAVFGGTVVAGPRPHGGWQVKGRLHVHTERGAT